MLCAGNVREPDRGEGGVNGVGMEIEWVWDGEDWEMKITVLLLSFGLCY